MSLQPQNVFRHGHPGKFGFGFLKRLLASGERVREDLPEAKPVIAAIDEIVKVCADRHDELSPTMQGLIHPSELATPAERERMHKLKMALRSKSREEAHADILIKRQRRKEEAMKRKK